MKQLVFVQNDQAVTDSLTVAEVFGKRHDLVMRDIRNLECSESFNLLNFAEIDYLDDRNRSYKKFLIKRDGLAFLVFGYTGKKAAEYKEKYIQAFNTMEEQLKKPKQLSEKDKLIASMKLSIESAEKLEEIEEDVANLKTRFDNELTLHHGQATSLQHAVKQRVEKLWKSGQKGVLETKQQMYANLHSQLKRAFHAPTYREIKRIEFNEALNWVNAWRPL
ncbi:phage regulatory protein [Gracilibacillus salitolerans]|uniref:Phage regulatory protein n=1 Tax=Gracilibacillus salitolerans TaxID=2663022 RepID=A0A5Q2TKK0_9BACI|nr:Rha family transcriptional regulator [Gracilibacillus salitolerans]QGH35165.1 phage regulatory protein [Gracilibacillus salitolerans]